jgi:hypothetical protein
MKRFWDNVAKTETCWLWLGARGGHYGSYYSDGKSVLAHRFAYEALVGPIPDGLQIDHLCRVRLCVNPAHLEPVTQRENILRGTGPTAVNARKTHCPKGHQYDEGNTRWYKNKRWCRACHREQTRQARQAGQAA